MTISIQKEKIIYLDDFFFLYHESPKTRFYGDKLNPLDIALSKEPLPLFGIHGLTVDQLASFATATTGWFESMVTPDKVEEPRDAPLHKPAVELTQTYTLDAPAAIVWFTVEKVPELLAKLKVTVALLAPTFWICKAVVRPKKPSLYAG